MKHLTWHNTSIGKQQRRLRNGHGSFVIWLTGLSGAGKSTLANALESTLFQMGIHTYLLDGDNVRLGINSNLGFEQADRTENIRRVAETAKLFVDAGVVVIAALISPMQADRDMARQKFENEEFFEVFVDCPLAVCLERDPKGLYQKAIQGQIPNFTGVSAPYETPQSPHLTIRTDQKSVVESVNQILTFLMGRKLLPLSVAEALATTE